MVEFKSLPKMIKCQKKKGLETERFGKKIEHKDHRNTDRLGGRKTGHIVL